jgi:hypothetical protein
MKITTPENHHKLIRKPSMGVIMDYYVRDAIHTSCCFAKCSNNLYDRSTDTFETMEILSDYDPHLEFCTLSMLFTAVSTINRGQPSLEKGKVMCLQN